MAATDDSKHADTANLTTSDDPAVAKEKLDTDSIDSKPKKFSEVFEIDFGLSMPGKPATNLQDAFQKFKQQRQDDIREQKRMLRQKRDARRDPDRMEALRHKFLEQTKRYFGVPYARKYWSKDSPEYNSPLFLDCCGLVRQVMRDLQAEFGFRLGPWNQAYMYDTLPIALREQDMKPGDLVFMTGTNVNPKSKKQRHNMMHVEVWLGEGPKTIGARWNNGKVQVFDSYRFQPKSFRDERYHFRSIDTWLRGVCKSNCDQHKWGMSTYTPGKKSVFYHQQNLMQQDQRAGDDDYDDYDNNDNDKVGNGDCATNCSNRLLKDNGDLSGVKVQPQTKGQWCAPMAGPVHDWNQPTEGTSSPRADTNAGLGQTGRPSHPPARSSSGLMTTGGLLQPPPTTPSMDNRGQVCRRPVSRECSHPASHQNMQHVLSLTHKRRDCPSPGLQSWAAPPRPPPNPSLPPTPLHHHQQHCQQQQQQQQQQLTVTDQRRRPLWKLDLSPRQPGDGHGISSLSVVGLSAAALKKNKSCNDLEAISGRSKPISTTARPTFITTATTGGGAKFHHQHHQQRHYQHLLHPHHHHHHYSKNTPTSVSPYSKSPWMHSTPETVGSLSELTLSPHFNEQIQVGEDAGVPERSSQGRSSSPSSVLAFLASLSRAEERRKEKVVDKKEVEHEETTTKKKEEDEDDDDEKAGGELDKKFVEDVDDGDDDDSDDDGDDDDGETSVACDCCVLLEEKDVDMSLDVDDLDDEAMDTDEELDVGYPQSRLSQEELEGEGEIPDCADSIPKFLWNSPIPTASTRGGCGGSGCLPDESFHPTLLGCGGQKEEGEEQKRREGIQELSDIPPRSARGPTKSFLLPPADPLDMLSVGEGSGDNQNNNSSRSQPSVPCQPTRIRTSLQPSRSVVEDSGCHSTSPGSPGLRGQDAGEILTDGSGVEPVEQRGPKKEVWTSGSLHTVKSSIPSGAATCNAADAVPVDGDGGTRDEDGSPAAGGRADHQEAEGGGGGGQGQTGGEGEERGRRSGRRGGKKTPRGRPTRLPACSLSSMAPTFFVGGGNGVSLVEGPLLAMGWKRITDKHDDRYKLKWVECKSKINYTLFKEGDQLVNHIPNCKLLTNKLGLLCSLQEHERVTLATKGRPPTLRMCDFVPETYKVDERVDRAAFLDVYKEGEMWICKPVGMNQGKGIFLIRSREEIDNILLCDRDSKRDSNKYSTRIPMSRLVQRYIPNPLLLEGRKFDIRAYMLIASTVPYLVLFHQGYIRLSCLKYDDKDTNLTTHLTNQFVQKKDPTYKEVKEDTAWSMDKFNGYINEHYSSQKGIEKDWTFKTMTRQMQKIMLHCFNSVKHKLQRKIGYFDLYGLDFMIDTGMKVWLIEINVNPALQINCEALKEVIPNVVEETLHISIEAFEKTRKHQSLMPLQSLKGFQVLHCGDSPFNVVSRQIRSVSPSKSDGSPDRQRQVNNSHHHHHHHQHHHQQHSNPNPPPPPPSAFSPHYVQPRNLPRVSMSTTQVSPYLISLHTGNPGGVRGAQTTLPNISRNNGNASQPSAKDAGSAKPSTAASRNAMATTTITFTAPSSAPASNSFVLNQSLSVTAADGRRNDSAVTFRLVEASSAATSVRKSRDKPDRGN